MGEQSDDAKVQAAGVGSVAEKQDRCQYPGCARAVPQVSGRGRPARYCGETVLGTVHNRGNALTRRTQLARVGVDAERAVSEPVTVARATAGDLVNRVELAGRELGQLGDRLVEALRTMDSPEQAAAQAAAATETARAQAAAARAEAAAAATRAEQAAAQAAQAVADAQDADAEAGAARQEATRAAASAAAAGEALAGEQAEHAATRRALADQAAAAAAQRARAEQAESEVARLGDVVTAVTAERDQARAQALALQGELAQARAVAAERESALTHQTSRLAEDLSTARAQVDQLHTDVRAADAATAAATTRAEHAERDVQRLIREGAALTAERDSLVSQVQDATMTLADVRATAAARQAAATEQITRLAEDLSTARAQVDQLHTDVRAADAATAAATTRAEHAETDVRRLRGRSDR